MPGLLRKLTISAVGDGLTVLPGGNSSSGQRYNGNGSEGSFVRVEYGTGRVSSVPGSVSASGSASASAVDGGEKKDKGREEDSGLEVYGLVGGFYERMILE
jgi:hypothetical protein